MFTHSTRYSTLSQQVARSLEDDIRRGILRECLPGERKLAETLQVSRRTIRAAVQILCHKNLAHRTHGMETKILKRPEAGSSVGSLRHVGLLVSTNVADLYPFASIVGILRDLLHVNGFRLEIHSGRRYFSPRPSGALAGLVAQFPHDGWILASTTRACQEWFGAQRIPAVVFGTAHEGVDLPCVDLDMRATSRHAANVLLRKGHRRVVLIMEDTDWAGLQRTEQGFLEGVRQFGDEATAQVFKHDGQVASLQRVVARLLQPPAPTALYIVNPYHYLTVASVLAAKGLDVPRDMSLLCRDDETCLRYLPVTPSRYVRSDPLLAKALFAGLIRHFAPDSRETPAKSVLLLPQFNEGASLAVCR